MASSPLLWTKLQAPICHSRQLDRHHLQQKLDSGLEKQLTLVTAPAGYGKSALLSTWYQRQREPSHKGKRIGTAWLSLDESDNDPLRFLAYFLAAVQSAAPHVGKTTQAILETQRQTQVEPLLVPLINDLTGNVPLQLVLDDYHTLHHPQIHEYITFLLAQAPAVFHLIISSRTSPPLPLGRFRAQQQLLEIGTADLRLTPQEGRCFWQEVVHLPLSAEDSHLLHQRTEGWLTGMQLAALFLQRNTADASPSANLAHLIQAFNGSHEYIVDYLAGEVLQHQPPEIVRFLRQTAVLPRFCAALCDALGIGVEDGSKRVESQKILDYLRQQKLFLEPLDHESRWFRYHPLFGEFLKAQLYRREEAAVIAANHQKASEWFAANDSLEEALHHALQAGNEQWAAALIESHCLEAWLSGDFHLLQRWFGRLSESTLAARPRLCLYRAWVLTADGDYGNAAASLEQAAQAPPAADPELNAMLATIPLLLRFQHTPDPSQTVAAIRQTIATLPAGSSPWRLLALIALGAASAELGEGAEAEQAFYGAVGLSEKICSDYLTYLAYHNLLEFQLRQGRLRLAQEICTRLLHLAEASRLNLLLQSMAHFSLGEILLEWNHRPEAARHLQATLTIGEQLGKVAVQANALTRLAWLSQLEGAVPKARSYFNRTTLLLHHRADDPASRALHAAQGAALALAWNDWDRLNHWIHLVEAAAPWTEQPLSESGRIETITLAYVFVIRAYQNQEPELAHKALALLDQLEQLPGKYKRGRLSLELLAQRACALFILDDESALEPLEKVLTLAEPEGFCRLFLILGQPMESLLRRAANKGLSPDYVHKLLLAFAAHELENDKLLTERERDVLRLVAAGQNNQLIAATLCVSVNTVKTHLKRINTKLETQNRLAAVSRAHELSLL